MTRHWMALTLGGLLTLLLASGEPNAQVIEPGLQQTLGSVGPTEKIAVIISLEDRVDPTGIRSPSREERRRRLVGSLRSLAERTQPPLAAFLQASGATGIKQLWIINGIAATLPASAIPAVANQPGVAEIRLDGTLSAPLTTLSTAPPEWNIEAVRAPELWDMGYSGNGVVVASMDTGVDADHPDLSGKWRGGVGSWYDPSGQHPTTPFDPSGHGTQALGLIVGGDAGGTTIGVAPGAEWIAVKIFDDSGQASLSDVHLGFQWLLDPDGDPSNDDAPDVVNASWGYEGSAGECILEFDDDITILKAADIAVVFSAGNAGPWASSSVSPANNPSGFGVGSIQDDTTAALTSSRGPSACDGTIFPEVVAPGVSVRTADLSFGGFPFYATVSGTSFAAPHVSGAMALLAGALPGTTVAQLEEALKVSAFDLGDFGDDNTYGSGLIDIVAAYDWIAGAPPANPAIEIRITPDSQSVSVDGNDGTANFTITVTNTGDVDLLNVAVSDANAPDCARDIGALTVAQSVVYPCTQTLADELVDIVSAGYDARKKKLSVTATSSLGQDANLEVDGLGPMTFKRQKWVFSERLDSDPGLVTVRGRAIVTNTATVDAVAPDGTALAHLDSATIDAVEQH